jgi:hypothetical protein
MTEDEIQVYDDLVIATLRRAREFLLEAVQMEAEARPNLSPEKVAEMALRLGGAISKAVAAAEFQRRRGVK